MSKELLKLQDELCDLYHQTKGLYEIFYLLDLEQMISFTKNGESDSKDVILENLKNLFERLNHCVKDLENYREKEVR